MIFLILLHTDCLHYNTLRGDDYHNLSSKTQCGWNNCVGGCFIINTCSSWSLQPNSVCDDKLTCLTLGTTQPCSVHCVYVLWCLKFFALCIHLFSLFGNLCTLVHRCHIKGIVHPNPIFEKC